MRFEEHSRVSCIYFQVLINLVKTEEYIHGFLSFYKFLAGSVGGVCEEHLASRSSAVAALDCTVVHTAS